MLRIAGLVLVTLFSVPRLARAQSRIDMIEHYFGASNINAISGNGGMSVGISPVGDLAVLTWPSPSYTDQLLHIASNALDVREQDLMVSHEKMGAFLGLYYETADSSGMTWLREAGTWSVSQGYHHPEAAVVETVFAHSGLGLTVTLTDFVLPASDVWVRHVNVARNGTSPVTSATVLWYANLSPTLSRVPQLPVADWAFDAFNDFAALYDSTRQAIIHFRPEGRGDVTEMGHLVSPPDIDYGEVGTALGQPGFDGAAASSLVSDLDSYYGPGVYLAAGAAEALSGFQVGFDRTPTCRIVDELVDNVLALSEVFPEAKMPLDPTVVNMVRCEVTIEEVIGTHGWVYDATDAFDDASDGLLSGSVGAAGQVNEALAVPVAFAGGEGSATFYLAGGSTAADALAMLEQARQTPYGDHLAATVDHWQSWISTARMPATDDERVLAVCRRALINVKVGTDAVSSAIVASISRQAPYGQDWPRDGAFFNAALDLAGYHDLVHRHNQFYLQTIRTEHAEAELFINEDPPVDPSNPTRREFPADSWEMNYYADGMVGGNIRFEIDNTGLAVWALVAHAGFIENDSDRMAYLEEVWPTVQKASDLLCRWRDPENGLQGAANEDDNMGYTQTLHGAVTVYAGIASAARAARTLGHTNDAQRYEYRAWELKKAVLTRMYDEESGLFSNEADTTVNLGNAPGGASSWLVWPARMLPFDDDRVQRQLRANLDTALVKLDPATGGGAYMTKILVSAALVLTDPASRADLETALRAMVEMAATPDTHILGETFVPVDTDNDGVNDTFSPRVSNPHLWAATLVYLTAMAMYNPELFDPHIERLAPLEEPKSKDGGCGCATGRSGRHPLPALLFLVIAFVLGLRRKAR